MKIDNSSTKKSSKKIDNLDEIYKNTVPADPEDKFFELLNKISKGLKSMQEPKRHRLS